MQGMSGFLALPLLRTEEPETVLYNGNFWTLDQVQPRAQAVAISSGRFVAVGSNAEVLPLAGAGTRKVDLAFKSVLPGFNDAHSHPVASGVEHLHKVACDMDSIEKIQAALHERAQRTPAEEWVLGFLYDDGRLLARSIAMTSIRPCPTGRRWCSIAAAHRLVNSRRCSWRRSTTKR
jgi:predicted amidohydrolase YtcJ